MATITKATKRKWIKEAAAYLPSVKESRRAALALRRESLGKTYRSRAGTIVPLNRIDRERLASTYCDARGTYHHMLNRWRAFEVRS